MKDLNGNEIDFADEGLFPLEFMMPKRNRLSEEKVDIRYEEKSEDEEVEEMVGFMHFVDDELI
jgi:hypothetical protein